MKPEKIKEKLIYSCLRQKPLYFLPYLFMGNVETAFPTKIRFFSFFYKTVINSKKQSKGKLVLNSYENKFTDYDSRVWNCLEFYDSYHKYYRLSIHIIIDDNKLILDMPPF